MNVYELSEDLLLLSQKLSSGEAFGLNGFRLMTNACIMLKVQQTEIEILQSHVKNLESQVYGGTTK
jgi:hypothetical protein